jgi:hypothetical protein
MKESVVTTKTAVRKTAATKSAKQLVEVTLRRSAGGGGVPKGHYVLIINPKTFGSSGANWLGGKSFESKEAALAAAAKLGGRVAA